LVKWAFQVHLRDSDLITYSTPVQYKYSSTGYIEDRGTITSRIMHGGSAFIFSVLYL
jgi:hypothetical protein